MNTKLLRSGLVLSLMGGAALVASLPISAQTYNSPSSTPSANTPPANAPAMNAPSTNSSATAAKTTDDDAAEFGRLDKNKDGFIDKSEAILEPRLLTNFEAADTNHDGKVDKAEWAAFQKNKNLVVKKQ